MSVEVEVDGFVLTDLETGEMRSPRGAVTYTFTSLGERAVTVRGYDASGALVLTRELSVSLR